MKENLFLKCPFQNNIYVGPFLFITYQISSKSDWIRPTTMYEYVQIARPIHLDFNFNPSTKQSLVRDFASTSLSYIGLQSITCYKEQHKSIPVWSMNELEHHSQRSVYFVYAEKVYNEKARTRSGVHLSRRPEGRGTPT